LEKVSNQVKGKACHTPSGVQTRCSSPFLWPWACRWIYQQVCDEWPVWCQTYGYLPSHRMLRNHPLASTKFYCLV